MLWEIFITFFKIGLFTFGGGYAMIPLIKQEVINHNWISEELLFNFIGISESTPGPIAINMATFIGSSQAGILGALVATIGVVLPSFIIILLIAIVFQKILKNKFVQSFLDGIKPVIIGLILASGLEILLKTLFVDFTIYKPIILNYKSVLILIVLLTISGIYEKVKKKKLSAIKLIGISIFLGIMAYAI